MSEKKGLQNFERGGVLPHVAVQAYNFAFDSDNKIHDNEVAKTFGFKGGLVPGVADYDYLVRPVQAALGRDWLARGWAEARFLSPVYDGELVEARATVEEVAEESTQQGAGITLDLELFDPRGTPCAFGKAGLGASGLKAFALGFESADFPRAEMPSPERRPPASVEALPKGAVVGSLDIVPRNAETMEELSTRYNDPSLARRTKGELAPLPSSFFLDRANRVLSSNVLLGPWIHVGSKIEHHVIPDSSEELCMRGVVHDSYVRKGHEFVVLDLLVCGQNDRSVASVRHTAIVKPRR